MIDTSSRLLQRLDLLNTQNEKVSYQLSTGEELENGSDDSVLYGQIIGLEDDINTYEGIENQIDRAMTFNTISDSTVASIKDYVESVKADILTALTDTTDDDTRAAMSSNLENVKESLFDLVNEDSSGMYLFSGSDTTIEPFEMDADGNVSYVGSSELKTALVDKGMYKEQGLTGYDVMYYSTDSAKTGENLTFSEGEVLLDKDGDTWEFIDPDRTTVYLNGDVTSTALAVTTTSTAPLTYELTNTEDATIEAKESYFNILDDLINALALVDSDGNDVTSDEAGDVLSDSLQRMDDAFNSVNTAHAVLGGKNESFENYSESISAKIASYTIFHGEYAGADLTEAALKAQSLEITFSALYSTISKVNSMSLVDYI